MENAKIEIVNGIAKESKKPYKALKITIGEWSKMVFPGSKEPLVASKFELDYIEKTLIE